MHAFRLHHFCTILYIWHKLFIHRQNTTSLKQGFLSRFLCCVFLHVLRFLMLKCGVACSQVLINTSKMSVQVHDQSMVSHVLMEAGRFARCPVCPESFHWTESRFNRSMKVVSPESFSTGSKNKEKQIKFKIFF